MTLSRLGTSRGLIEAVLSCSNSSRFGDARRVASPVECPLALMSEFFEILIDSREKFSSSASFHGSDSIDSRELLERLRIISQLQTVEKLFALGFEFSTQVGANAEGMKRGAEDD